MQDRSHHWNHAEHLLRRADETGYGTLEADSMIAAAEVHAMLATSDGRTAAAAWLPSPPADPETQLILEMAARTAELAGRVATEAAAVVKDAEIAGALDLALTWRQLASDSEQLAGLAAEVHNRLTA
jgi:hypothetical protein